MKKYTNVLAGIVCGVSVLMLSGCGGGGGDDPHHKRPTSGSIRISYSTVGPLMVKKHFTLTTVPAIKGINGKVVTIDPVLIGQLNEVAQVDSLPLKHYTITATSTDQDPCFFIASTSPKGETQTSDVNLRYNNDKYHPHSVLFNLMCTPMLNIKAPNAQHTVKVSLTSQDNSDDLTASKPEQVTLSRQNGYSNKLLHHLKNNTVVHVFPLIDSRDYVAQFDHHISSSHSHDLVVKYKPTTHKMIAVTSINSTTQSIDDITNQHYNVIEWQRDNANRNNVNVMANWQNQLSNLTAESLLWVNDKDSLTTLPSAPVAGYVINVTSMDQSLKLYNNIHQRDPAAILVLNIAKPLNKASQLELKSWYQQVKVDKKWRGWLQVKAPPVGQKINDNYHTLLANGISKNDMVVDMRSAVKHGHKAVDFKNLLKQYQQLAVKGLQIKSSQINDNENLRNTVFMTHHG